MDRDVGASEPHRLRGPIDRAVLIRIRDLVVDSEPLGTATLVDFLDPRRSRFNSKMAWPMPIRPDSTFGGRHTTITRFIIPILLGSTFGGIATRTTVITHR